MLEITERGPGMGAENDNARNALVALARDTADAWTNFVHAAKGPVWKASLAVAPRRPRAQVLFSHVMSGLHAVRLALPSRPKPT